MRALALLTLRECHRRPFPYVAAAIVVLLALASHLFQGFTFGAGELESLNLAISAVFLAGLLHASFLATGMIRTDLERGTLGLVLTTPVGPATYLAGRLLGLCLSAVLLCSAVALCIAGIYQLPLGPSGPVEIGAAYLGGVARALAPVVVLEAAALFFSTFASRLVSPVLLIGLFVAGSIAGPGAVGWLLPDFSLFGLEPGASPPVLFFLSYTLGNMALFGVAGYLALAARTPLQSQA